MKQIPRPKTVFLPFVSHICMQFAQKGWENEARSPLLPQRAALLRFRGGNGLLLWMLQSGSVFSCIFEIGAQVIWFEIVHLLPFRWYFLYSWQIDTRQNPVSRVPVGRSPGRIFSNSLRLFYFFLSTLLFSSPFCVLIFSHPSRHR